MQTSQTLRVKVSTLSRIASLVSVILIVAACAPSSPGTRAKSEGRTEQSQPTTKRSEPPKGMNAITMKDLGLSEMDPEGDFYVAALFPFSESPVYYMVTGEAKYDAFFKDAASITGHVLLAQRIASAIQNKDMDVLVKVAINPDAPFIEARSPLYNFATSSLPDCSSKVKDLLATGKELSASVKSDFTGFKARKVPSITMGISESLNNLNTAVTEIPNLLKQLGFG